MNKIIRYTVSATALLFIVLSCKDEQAKVPQKAEIPADVLEAAEKWKKFESEADPLFLQALKHTDLGHQEFKFSKGNTVKYLWDMMFREKLDSPLMKEAFKDDDETRKHFEDVEIFLEEWGLLSWVAHASSTRKESEHSYVHKSFLLCEPGYEDKLIFSLLGGKEHELDLMKKVPKNAAFAISGTFDFAALVGSTDDLVERYPTVFKDYKTQMDNARQMSQMMQIELDQFLSDLSQEGVFILTLSEDERIAVDKGIEIPKPEILFALKGRGRGLESMLNFVQSQIPFTEVEEGGFKFFESEMQIPMINESLKYVLMEDKCVFGTSFKELQAFVSDEDSDNKEIEEAFRDFPKTGNSFVYVSNDAAKNFFDSLVENSVEIQTKLEEDDLGRELLNELQKSTESVFFSGVMSMKPEGVTIYSRGPFSFGQTSLVAVSSMGVGAALVMPALGTARAKAKEKQINNSLKQSGLAYIMYFSDGVNVTIPKDYHLAFEWELNDFSQEILDFTPANWEEVFSSSSPWKFFIQPGQKLVDIENANTALIAVPAMKSGDKLLVLYGDGHVETRSVSSWQDMSLEQLQKELK